MVNTFQEMMDPTDKKVEALVKYAEGVCRAVGIKYGVGHCEIKATFDEKKNKWVEWVRWFFMAYLKPHVSGINDNLTFSVDLTFTVP